MTDFATLTTTLAGSDWDGGNAEKNSRRHGVTRRESEEVFFNRPVLVADHAKHSAEEHRYLLLGRTNAERPLAIVFTIRGDRIRVISARPMSRKERGHYAKIPNEEP